MQYFLNVNNSMSNSIWVKASNVDSRKSEKISQKYDIPLILSDLISKNEINDDSVYEYLTPQLKKLLPDPSIFLDMDKSIKRFIEGIKKKKKYLFLVIMT